MKEILNTLGLIFNFIGTLLIVFYISIDHKEFVRDEGKPGEKWYSLISKHPRWLYFGIVLITIGFLLGLVGSLLR